MKSQRRIAAKVLGGLFAAAMCAMPQAYTISARPGVVNYVEGTAFVNGKEISPTKLKSTFLSANDTFSTDTGKAEVLLTPGVFLRIGDNSTIRMISPSLTNTQVALERGEAMLEVDDLLKDNNISILNHGATTTIQKTGLYKFATEPAPIAAVIDGKADVVFGDKKVTLGKGRQTVLDAALKSEKFDRKKVDDLYAWSNVRAEYVAAASYQSAKNVTVNNYGAWGGLGFGGWYSPGWYWNSGFNSWAWLPMNGAFYSPFGYGFYGPGVLPYAPVIVAPIYGGGGYVTGKPGSKTDPKSANNAAPPVAPRRVPVPISPKNPPVMGLTARSPYQNEVARQQAARSFNYTGFRTATGAPAGNFGGRSMSGGGVRMSSPRAGAPAGRPAGGGWSGGARSAGAAPMGGGHMSGAPAPAHK